MTKAACRDIEALIAAVLRWLRENPVPLGPSDAATEWRDGAKKLGSRAVPVLIQTLQYADDDLRYGAQMALRELGVEVWKMGYGDAEAYFIASPSGDVVRLTPLSEGAAEHSNSFGGMAGEDAIRSIPNPFERIERANDAIEERRAEMSSLASVRAAAVRELIDVGLSRRVIADRLGIHPNYVSQLAREAGGRSASTRSVSAEEVAQPSGTLSVAEAAAALSESPRKLRTDLRALRLLGSKLPTGEWRLPQAQFRDGRVAPHLKEVLTTLNRSMGHDDLIVWMTTPRPEVGGRVPLEQLWEDPTPVLIAASAASTSTRDERRDAVPGDAGTRAMAAT